MTKSLVSVRYEQVDSSRQNVQDGRGFDLDLGKRFRQFFLKFSHLFGKLLKNLNVTYRSTKLPTIDIIFPINNLP